MQSLHGNNFQFVFFNQDWMLPVNFKILGVQLLNFPVWMEHLEFLIVGHKFNNETVSHLFNAVRSGAAQVYYIIGKYLITYSLNCI